MGKVRGAETEIFRHFVAVFVVYVLLVHIAHLDDMQVTVDYLKTVLHRSTSPSQKKLERFMRTSSVVQSFYRVTSLVCRWLWSCRQPRVGCSTQTRRFLPFFAIRTWLLEGCPGKLDTDYIRMT